MFQHCFGTASFALACDILSFLRISSSFMKPPRIIQVLWHLPSMNWIKFNIDGLVKGNSSPSACDEVFRGSCQTIHLGFGMQLSTLTSFISELCGVIDALDIAKSRDFSHLWLRVFLQP